MKQSIVLFIVTACLTVALCIPQNPKAFQARATVTVDVTTQFNVRLINIIITFFVSGLKQLVTACQFREFRA